MVKDGDRIPVSIHASSREDATLFLDYFLYTLPGFNPRVLAGGRDSPTTKFAASDSGFNPRVLAGGRDLRLSITADRLSGFNPRVLAGGRDSVTPHPSLSSPFQSTRPRGRTRPMVFLFFLQEWGFNPRVLAGGRDNTIRS